MQLLNEGIKIETLAVAGTGDAGLDANMVTTSVRSNRLLIGLFTSTDDKLVTADCFALKQPKVTRMKRRRSLIFKISSAVRGGALLLTG